MYEIQAAPNMEKAIRAVADLLGRLRVDFLLVGEVARCAYLGGTVEKGPIDAIGLLGPQQKNQVAMMAANRGFEVSREELEASEELDLVPLRIDGARVHVLVASNALYGRMVEDRVPARFQDLDLSVPKAEDFALILQMSNDVSGLLQLSQDPSFDRSRYNRKLESIGLPSL